MNQPQASTSDTQVAALLGSVTSQRIAAVPAPARAVHRAILRALADAGIAPTRAQLGADLERHLETLAANDIIGLDDDGEIAYAYPFSTRPTAHRVQLPGGARPYAMCAVDALGIPAMLDTDAVITSRDPHIGEPITVSVTDHGTVASWQPSQTVVFLGSRADCETTTSAQSCCGYLNFFANHSNALAWAVQHPQITGAVLNQDQALALGVRYFGDLLRS
jgi:hypothetical protein